jgi:hypothetical protein
MISKDQPARSQRGIITENHTLLSGHICKILTSCLLSGPTEAGIPKYFLIVCLGDCCRNRESRVFISPRSQSLQ